MGLDKMMQIKSIARSLGKGLGVALAAVIVLSAGAALAADRVLTFPVPGVVVEVSAKAGQAVKQGQILARLDARIFNARLKQAKAAVDAAKLESGFAADAVARAQQLFDDLSASAEELERAKLRQAKAEADLAAATAKLVTCQWRAENAALRAPSGGTVVSVPGFKGQVIDPRAGLQPVVVLSGK